MRFVVVGAGAVGSFLGGSLARAGFDVTFVGRGPHARAMHESGLHVRGVRASFHVCVPIAAHPPKLEGTDVAIVAVKAHQLEALAADLGALARSGCTLVLLQNGIPFWYFEGFGGPLEGARLKSVDPRGALAAAIPTHAIVACVVNAGNRIPAPGHVEQVGSVSYNLGEPNAAETLRVRALVEAFVAAGLDGVLDRDIRTTIWIKLVGNAGLNPISALTRATIEEIAGDPLAAGVLARAMHEVREVGEAIGFDAELDVERRIEKMRAYGNQRTSMLQDLDAGRPLEIEPIAGAAVEIATLAGVDVPITRTLYALVKALDRGTSAGYREG